MTDNIHDKDRDREAAKVRPTFEQRTEMEHARGRQVAADNAKKFETAQAARKAEEDEAARAADPEGFAAKEEADRAAAEARPLGQGGVFPHADVPYQPVQPVQPDMGAPVVTDEVTGGVLPKPVGASRTEGQKEQGVPSVQDAAIPSETIKGDAVQPPKQDPANPNAMPAGVDTTKP